MIFYSLFGGAHGVMVIIEGSYQSSNPEQGCLDST